MDNNLRDTRGSRKDRQGSASPNIQGKIPPQALELEEAVLGAVMLEKYAFAEIESIISGPEVFYKDQHGLIWKAISTLHNQNTKVDILTVTEQLRRTGDLENAGGAYYVTMLTSRVSSAANIETHARIVVEKYIAREVIRVAHELLKNAYDDTTDAFDLVNYAESAVLGIQEIATSGADIPEFRTHLQNTIDSIEKTKATGSGITGVPTGLIQIDTATSGWQKGNLIILAARPGMGKSALAMQIARAAAADFGKHVAVFSLEMTAIELVSRLLSQETSIFNKRLRSGTLVEWEWTRINQASGRMENYSMYIDDTPGMSIFELRSKARRLKLQGKLDKIVIDYLQLMRGESHNRMGNREQEISFISRSLKNLAKELDVPIIALSQLSREVEKRGGTKRPMLSDLRESGSIEQDADVVMFLYRPEYYQITELPDGSSSEGYAELIIAKNRAGSVGDVPIRWEPNLTKFSDWEQPLLPSSGGSISIAGEVRKNDDWTSDDDVPF